MLLHYKKNQKKSVKVPPNTIVALLFFAHVLSAISSDIFLPALKQLQDYFGTSEFMAQLSIIIFYVGAIVSRTIWGAVSDIYGRKTALLYTLSLQTTTLFLCIYAKDIYTLIFFRFLQSFGSGYISVICVAIIADLFVEKDRARVYALMDISFPLGFTLGPVLGAIISDNYGWQGCFWFAFYAFLIVLLLVIFILPETNKTKANKSLRKIYLEYFKLFRDKRLLYCGLIVGLSAGGYMSFVIHAPYIYMLDNNLSKIEFAIFQLIPMLISGSSLLIYRKMVLKYGTIVCLKKGMYLFSILNVIFFSIQVLAEPLNQYVVLSLVCAYCAIIQFIIPSLTSMAISIFPQRSGMSSSVLSSLRAMLMLLCMLVTGYFVESNAIDIFYSMAIMISLCMILLVSTVNRYAKMLQD